MDETKKSDSLMMEILHDAFPGRSHEQVVPFALIYSGVMWGRDFRFGAVPEDENGTPVLVCRSEEMPAEGKTCSRSRVFCSWH